MLRDTATDSAKALPIAPTVQPKLSPLGEQVTMIPSDSPIIPSIGVAEAIIRGGTSLEKILLEESIIRLVRSDSFSLRSQGTGLITHVLTMGKIEPTTRQEEIEEIVSFRESGHTLARIAVKILFPDVNRDFIRAWIDGGTPETWLQRVQQNREMIRQLEEDKPGCVAELTRLFGIKNFYRFPLAHWKRQYEERYALHKTHLPFFMGAEDEKGEHQTTVGKILAFGSENQSRFAIRIYESETYDEIISQLYQSALAYGAAKSNAYIVSHGNMRGIHLGSSSFGGINILKLPTTQFADAIMRAVDPLGYIVLISCATGANLDENDAREFGKEGFAERLSGFSQRNVIAVDAPVGLQRLEYENGDSNKTVVPVYYLPQGKIETHGKVFSAQTIRRKWAS